MCHHSAGVLGVVCDDNEIPPALWHQEGAAAQSGQRQDGRDGRPSSADGVAALIFAREWVSLLHIYIFILQQVFFLRLVQQTRL